MAQKPWSPWFSQTSLKPWIYTSRPFPGRRTANIWPLPRAFLNWNFSFLPTSGQIDVFFWEDALKVIEGARHGARVGVIAHIQSIMWSNAQNQGKSLTADWLVLDLLADAIMGEPFGAKVSKHLRNYAIRTGSKQIYKIVSDSKTNKELIQAISCMGSNNRDRILTRTNFPGKPLLCSVQLDSSPFSRNQKYYMSSVLLWRKPSG